MRWEKKQKQYVKVKGREEGKGERGERGREGRREGCERCECMIQVCSFVLASSSFGLASGVCIRCFSPPIELILFGL